MIILTFDTISVLQSILKLPIIFFHCMLFLPWALYFPIICHSIWFCYCSSFILILIYYMILFFYTNEEFAWHNIFLLIASICGHLSTLFVLATSAPCYSVFTPAFLLSFYLRDYISCLPLISSPVVVLPFTIFLISLHASLYPVELCQTHHFCLKQIFFVTFFQSQYWSYFNILVFDN